MTKRVRITAKKSAPAVGVFQEPDTVHLLALDPQKAIAKLASIIIGQNDELLAAVKALREEVRSLRPAPNPLGDLFAPLCLSEGCAVLAPGCRADGKTPEPVRRLEGGAIGPIAYECSADCEGCWRLREAAADAKSLAEARRRIAAGEAPAPQLEPEAPDAEAPAVGETLELALTEPEPAAPVRKRRSFADNAGMQEASRETSAAIRELAALRKALAVCTGARESRKLMHKINDAEKRRAEWGRVYRQLHKIACESNP